MNQTSDRDLQRRRVLGRGLACRPVEPGLDLGRDLTLAAGPGGLDLAMVDGLDNLTQCLEVALTTVLGSDVFNTEFGFDGINALVEETDRVLVRERVRVSIIRLLSRDARVRRIVDLKLIDGRLDAPTGEDAVGAIGAGTDAERLDRWRTVEVQVGFETVAGDRALIDLGRVVTNG